MALRKFIIERDIPAVGSLEREQLQGAAAKSNGVLRELGPDIQWVESYVAADKTFCVYLAKDEAIIKKHAEISGFPASKITEVRKMIAPTTAHAPSPGRAVLCPPARAGGRGGPPPRRGGGVGVFRWRAPSPGCGLRPQPPRPRC